MESIYHTNPRIQDQMNKIRMNQPLCQIRVEYLSLICVRFYLKSNFFKKLDTQLCIFVQYWRCLFRSTTSSPPFHHNYFQAYGDFITRSWAIFRRLYVWNCMRKVCILFGEISKKSYWKLANMVTTMYKTISNINIVFLNCLQVRYIFVIFSPWMIYWFEKWLYLPVSWEVPQISEQVPLMW